MRELLEAGVQVSRYPKAPSHQEFTETLRSIEHEYSKTLSSIEQETEDLLRARAQIDKRLTQLKTTADSLRDLLGVGGLDVKIDKLSSGLGVTGAIRKVLWASKIPLSSSQIKAGLENLGVDLSIYANPAAVIHNTVTRLERQNEVVRVVNSAGQTVAYTMNPGVELIQREGEIILDKKPAPSPSSSARELTMRDKK